MSAKAHEIVLVTGGVAIVAIVLFFASKGQSNVNNISQAGASYVVSPNFYNVNPPAGYAPQWNFTFPSYGVSSGCDCGCDGPNPTNADSFASLAADYSDKLSALEKNYEATIEANIPTYLLQYWNNPTGYALSQNAAGVL
jgi:hypothetical protein